LEGIIDSISGLEQIKCESTDIYTLWINLIKSLPKNFLSIFEKGMNSKKPLLIENLVKNLGELSDELSFDVILKLSPHLTKIILLSEKKLTDRGVAIFSMKALLKGSLKNPNNKELSKEVDKVIKLATGVGNFLLSEETLLRLNEEELIGFIQLIEILLKSNQKIDLKKSEIWLLIISVCSTKYFKVRKMAKEFVETILNNKNQDHFLNGFIQFTNSNLSDINNFTTIKNIKNTFLLISQSPDLSIENLKNILFYSHYPTLVSKKRYYDTWNNYISKFKKIDIKTILLKDLDSIFKFLIEKQSKNEIFSKCSSYALSSLISTIGDESTEYILSYISDNLLKINENMKIFDATDIQIYLTPKNKTFRDVSKEEYNPMKREGLSLLSKKELLKLKHDMKEDEWQLMFKKEKEQEFLKTNKKTRLEILTGKFIIKYRNIFGKGIKNKRKY
jgi:hypothetical protein